MSRWIRLAAAVVAMIQISNLQYAWTIFVQPLRNAHPDWSLTDVQWGFSIFIAMETWAMPLTGWLIDKHGPRLLMSIGGVLCAVGWAGIGGVHSVLALYLLYGLAGLGAAIVYCGAIGVALKWFPDRRGLAAGMIAAGFGSGATIIMIVNSIQSVRDYALANFANTFLFTGILQGALIILAAQFLGGSGVAPPASAKPQATAARDTTHNFNSAEMLATRQFYWLYAMMLMMGVGGLLATAQVSQVASNFGIGASALGISLILNPIANGGGRFFWGWVSDRLGRERTMTIAFFIQSLSLVGVMALGPHADTPFIVGMFLVFFTWGEVYSLFPSVSADFFGRQFASSNYSFLYSTKGVASILAGGAAAWLFTSTGTWAPAFYGSAVLAMISCVMAVRLRKMPLPAKQTTPLPAMTATKA